MDIKKAIGSVQYAQDKTVALRNTYFNWVKKFLPSFFLSCLLFAFFSWSFFSIYASIGFEKTVILFFVLVVVNAVRGTKVSS